MSEAPRSKTEGAPANTKGALADSELPAAQTDERDRNVPSATLPSLRDPEQAARRAALHSGRHPAGRHLRRPVRPAPGCFGCKVERETGPLPGWHHDCARSLPTRLALAEDYRTLVALRGEGFERPFKAHEVTDFQLQDVRLEHERDYSEAWVEIEPTDDYGISRRYCTIDPADPNQDFPEVIVVQGWMTTDGATARQWVTA